MDQRRIRVQRVRDTFSEPLVEETLDSNPFIKRGRWLVSGIDLDMMEERSFYVESMVAVMELGQSTATRWKLVNGFPAIHQVSNEDQG